MSTRTVDAALLPWQKVRGRFREKDGDTYRSKPNLGLLLGNGASVALWDRFRYDSLYEFACAPERVCPLVPVDQAFFTDMDTVNFESVLSALATTRMVCGHLKKDATDVNIRYDSIRRSLFGAVRDIHVPFERVSESLKLYLRQVFSQYNYIYTTNYDLIPYWAMRGEENPDSFKDFFWHNDQSFDPANSHEWAGVATYVLFLHGALHLYHDAKGSTKKLAFSEADGGIMSKLDTGRNHIPLFVSEGTSRDKVRSIRRNEYLNFAYWKFTYHRGPLVVFGSTLSKEHDQHILDAMKRWYQYDRVAIGRDAPPRMVAISVYPKTDPVEIISLKNRILSELDRCEVEFFDSTTHPLGDSKYAIV